MIKIVSAVIIAVLTIFLVSNFLGERNNNIISDIKPRELQSDNNGQISIIALGDSLTSGFGLPLEDSYPAQLEDKLNTSGQNVKVINSGVSGETTRGNLERAPFIRSQNSDIVLLGIGGNDALRALPIEETSQNISETISILKSGIDPPVVVLLKMQAPLNGGVMYKLEFDEIYERLSKEHNVILTPFITTDIFFKRENRLPDGIHLNKAGYAQIVDSYLYQTVKTIVEKLDK